MKHEIISNALEQISDGHITEALRKRRWLAPWLSAVAAVLAVVIALNFVVSPVTAGAVSPASPYRGTVWPDIDDYKDTDAYRAAMDAFLAEQTAREVKVSTTSAALTDYLLRSSRLCLSEQKNRVWSPLNSCIALAMLAETTGGQTRQQILDVLGVTNVDGLRAFVSAAWEAVYADNGKEICTLANSLWLSDTLSYRQEAVENLSYHHYASVYQGAFGSEKMDALLHDWLNDNTGNFLRDSVDALRFSPETALALASTIYLKSKWTDSFNTAANTTGGFHTPTENITCTFMNQKGFAYYYWGDTFGAVSLGMENGCRMWLILPDEGKTPSDVLAGDQYLAMLQQSRTANKKFVQLKLSVPKFDVSTSADLAPMLKDLGITDVFSPGTANFTPSLSAKVPIWVDAVNQAARVAIDEEGVTAASYTVIVAPTSPEPPEETVEFVLDRPFLFVIEKSGLPLFTGTVYAPL